MNHQLLMKIRAVFRQELEKYMMLSNSETKWRQLELLHIIGQSIMSLHLRTHWLMLNLAIEEAKAKEVLGQILRLSLVFPGHLFGKLPIGNVGTARVSAFLPMELPRDIEDILKK